MRMRAFIILCCCFFAASCGVHSGANVNIGTMKSSASTDTYTIDESIPQISGLIDPSVQRDINAKLRQIAISASGAFIKDLRTNTPMPNSPGDKSSFHMDFQTQEASPHFLSFLFNESEFMAGSAHPNNFTQTFNYDIDLGSAITLNDLFKKSATGALKKISTLAVAKLIDLSKKNQTYYDQKQQWISAGAGPKADNFKSFSVKNGQLILSFDPYQVASYAEGEQTIAISRPEIIDLLSDEGRKILSETQQTTSQ